MGAGTRTAAIPEQEHQGFAGLVRSGAGTGRLVRTVGSRFRARLLATGPGWAEGRRVGAVPAAGRDDRVVVGGQLVGIPVGAVETASGTGRRAFRRPRRG